MRTRSGWNGRTAHDGGYDAIVVGAGSSGAVVAARLAADAARRVLLLEAGPADDHWSIRMPAGGLKNITTGRFNWQYWTEPEPALQNRRLYQPRGRVLGGSSSLNGMIFVRGNAGDYDGWGVPGWSYAEVLHYFRRLEAHATIRDAYRGADGPVRVVQGSGGNPLYEAFIEAGVQAGYPRTADTNGFQQEGFGRFDMNVDGGVRASTAHAYLRRPPHNLTILTGARATRVVVERGRAVGVEYVRAGARQTARADGEIVLAGGAFNSPQLLMLSGIGPADELRRLGLGVVQDLPGVGRNLHDHVEVHVDQACRLPITLYGAMKPMAKLRIGAAWFLTKGGMGATNHYEAGAFLRSAAGVRWPDIQIHFVPICYSSHHDRRAVEHGYRMHIGPLRQTSRGSVTLASADPLAPPVIRLNVLATEDDLRATLACFALGREIFAQRAFDPFRGPERQPGPAANTPSELEARTRETAVSAYHPCGTCRMGTDDLAVVDPQGRVRGVERLRVADASIIPQVTSGNLNAPAMMIGEKIAAMMRGEAPLREDVPVYEPAGWQARQR